LSPSSVLPPHIFAIPSDLLTPYERRLNRRYIPIWIRTDYTPGTDIVHHSLLTTIPPNSILNSQDDDIILDNAERYSFLAFKPLESILAFVPQLVECHLNLYVQPDENAAWESQELQAQFLDKEEKGDSEEQKRHKRMVHQRSLFVADKEAMRTGYVLWVHLDQFGNVVQRNRVQPLLFGALGASDRQLSLGELGVGYEDGELEAGKLTGSSEARQYEGDTDEELVRDQSGNLKPRLVRRSSDARILDSLLALKTEQRFIA
jgi:hypothetical protein